MSSCIRVEENASIYSRGYDFKSKDPDQKCQQELSRLDNLSGSEFDREFARMAIEGHAKALGKLEGQSSVTSGSAQSSSTSLSSGTATSEQSALGSSAQTSTGSSSSDWQQYNQRMLSKLKDHQRKARDVARTVGVDQAAITSLETQARAHGVSTGSNGHSSDRSGSSSTGAQPNNSSATSTTDSRKDQ